MSHLKLAAGEVEAVDTRHGQVYVGLGVADDGNWSVVLIGPSNNDRHDLHLTAEQAEQLCETLGLAASALRMTRGRV